MSKDMGGSFDFEWFNDFRIRCKRDDMWVDFFFDLGGAEKEFPIFRRPVGTSENLLEKNVDLARNALMKYLEEIGYKVTILD